MTDAQPGILAPVPRLARYLSFSQLPEADPRASLAALAELADGDEIVVAVGHSLALSVGAAVDDDAVLQPRPQADRAGDRPDPQEERAPQHDEKDGSSESHDAATLGQGRAPVPAAGPLS